MNFDCTQLASLEGAASSRWRSTRNNDIASTRRHAKREQRQSLDCSVLGDDGLKSAIRRHVNRVGGHGRLHSLHLGRIPGGDWLGSGNGSSLESDGLSSSWLGILVTLFSRVCAVRADALFPTVVSSLETRTVQLQALALLTTTTNTRPGSSTEHEGLWPASQDVVDDLLSLAVRRRVATRLAPTIVFARGTTLEAIAVEFDTLGLLTAAPRGILFVLSEGTRYAVRNPGRAVSPRGVASPDRDGRSRSSGSTSGTIA